MIKRIVTLMVAIGMFASLAWLPASPMVRIVASGSSTQAVVAAIHAVGGTVEHEVAIIDGAIAHVSSTQLARLSQMGMIINVDAPIQAADLSQAAIAGPGIDPVAALGVTGLQNQGFDGEGVTVAVVDSGLPFIPNLNNGNGGRPDGAPKTDDSLFLRNSDGQFVLYKDFTSAAASHSEDPYGHGTHVAGLITKVAPKSNLVVARAIGDNGVGSYADTVLALDWIVSMKSVYNIRVLNLSLYSPISSPYWADTINRAVMGAWDAGIVVVAAAGNTGPTPMSLGVPGNNPYVVTVGAYRSASLGTSGQDEITNFSSRGPTESRFVKPDVLAPGVFLIAPLPSDSVLANGAASQGYLSTGTIKIAGQNSTVNLYKLSGSSMASAEVAGLVAMLLERSPNLTNDQVKWLLRSTTNVALDNATGLPRFSIWEQGWGKVNATQLFAYTGAVGSANAGMNVSSDSDINGTHYMGWTIFNPQTQVFTVDDPSVQNNPYFTWTNQTWAGQTWAPQTWAGQTWSGQTWSGQTWSGQSWAGQTWSGQTWANQTWAALTWASIAADGR